MEIHDGFLSGKPMTIYNNNVYFFPLKPIWKRHCVIGDKHNDKAWRPSFSWDNKYKNRLPLYESLSFISHHCVVCSCSKELQEQSTEKKTEIFRESVHRAFSNNTKKIHLITLHLILLCECCCCSLHLTPALEDLSFHDEDWVFLIISGGYWL